MTLDELPLVLTVPEAARLLRVSRNTGYELAKRYRVSGGREGLPVIVVMGTLRVPRDAFVRLLSGEHPVDVEPAPVVEASPPPRPKRSPRRHVDDTQLSLVELNSDSSTARDVG